MELYRMGIRFSHVSVVRVISLRLCNGGNCPIDITYKRPTAFFRRFSLHSKTHLTNSEIERKDLPYWSMSGGTLVCRSLLRNKRRASRTSAQPCHLRCDILTLPYVSRPPTTPTSNGLAQRGASGNVVGIAREKRGPGCSAQRL